MKRRIFLKNSVLIASPLLLPSLPSLGSLVKDNGDKINARRAAVPLKHYWSFCVGAGRANEGLRASWLDQLSMVRQHCGFSYCRFHGLFHDDMFVYSENNGKPVYNWQYVDDLFDRMLGKGVRPFVELSFMPKDMASTSNTTFWWKGHSSPPKDPVKWNELVEVFTRHCVDRYGLDEVRTWYFEVWNEPDLHGFWDGTKSQYFELYKGSVLAIKKVDQHLMVGGPATSNFVPDGRFDGETEDVSKHKTWTVSDINELSWRGVWITDFLSYCAKENLPVDFISTHPYPTDYAIDPETKHGDGRTRKVSSTFDDLTWLKKTVANSQFKNAKIHLTEWSSSPSPRDPMHDNLPAAAYILKTNLDCVGLADSLSYWTFTDVFEEGGAGSKIFHGGFGMINYQGIVKPAFHAYRMLNQLGDEELLREDGWVITRKRDTGKIVALVYHYPKEMKDAVGGDVNKVLSTGGLKKFGFEISALPANARFVQEILDESHGNCMRTWQNMGSPSSPTRSETDQLRRDGMATSKKEIKASAGGVLKFSEMLSPWTCILITQE